MTESSSVQQFVLGTPILPQSSSVQDFIRATPINPSSGSVQNFTKSAPTGHLGIRGPQAEQFSLQLDRLINDVGNLVTITTSIDLTMTGTTVIFSATQKSFIMGVLLRVTAADTVSATPNASVGVDPSINNVFADENLVSLNQVNDTYNFWSNLNTGSLVQTSEDLLFSVNTAATATSLVATCYVIGLII